MVPVSVGTSYTSIISDRATPTVIVARTPQPGRERDFERWLRRITDEAARQPGHIGSDLQPPGPQHPDEWVIIYQFADQPMLDAWISSPVRAELLAEGVPLTQGDARMQQVAMGAGEDPVTAVASFHVRPGHEAMFSEGFDEALDSLQAFDGFLRAQLFPPVQGVQEDTVIVFSFQSREQLDVWLESSARSEILMQLDQHVDGERQVNVVGGFGGWFSVDSKQVKTWKQAAIVLLGLYPTVLVLNEILGRIIPESVPYLLDVLIGLLISVATLSWLIMPRLTRALSGWLRR
ncbi:MAG: antibiotic biosynthesis monooxygenase [Acidimicrobiia bacterium]|nr:antibiotic biosynthesis monooxygenase [Acidimicrobiia bacterium]